MLSTRGVRNVAVHVERLGEAHGARRRKALGGCSGHEGGGVERDRRRDRATALVDACDASAQAPLTAAMAATASVSTLKRVVA